MPTGMLRRMMVKAKKKLQGAARPWARVYGPAAAVLATAERLGWVVNDAFCFTTDEGRHLDITEDPPAVVKMLVTEAVTRWKWRRIEAEIPSLRAAAGSPGARLEPVLKLLHSKNDVAGWGPEQRGGLRSAGCGRQWPQVRCFAAGYSGHNKCLFCLSDAGFDLDVGTDAEAMAMTEVPCGTLLHRDWS